jgi:hypothetical protein
MGLDQEGGSLGLLEYRSTNSLALALVPLKFSQQYMGTQRFIVYFVCYMV